MRRLRIVLLLLVALLLVPGGAAAQPTAFFGTTLSGDEEVPPRETPARGFSLFRLTSGGEALHYRLIVANIENVVAAHIHVGEEGTNGPVVAFMFGPVDPGGGPSNGVLSQGTITADDLVGPLEGEPLSVLIEEMAAGGTYVNVHTNDGVDPPNTGPGDFPGGEIRGQIELLGSSS